VLFSAYRGLFLRDIGDDATLQFEPTHEALEVAADFQTISLEWTVAVFSALAECHVLHTLPELR
jgi:hypothetical protein